MGGDAADFREMKHQYDNTMQDIKNSRPLPDIYNRNGNYQWWYQPIKYITRDGYFYYFERVSGCEVRIDKDHNNLIFEKQIRL